MSSRPRKRLPGPVTRMLVLGIVLGTLIMLGLAWLLLQDRAVRLASAQRQALALSSGVDRLLRQEFGSLERAMAGIAADAASYAGAGREDADALLRAAIAGVVARSEGLESIVVVDAAGRPLSEGRGDPALPDWAQSSRGQHLAIGPLQPGEDGEWLLRVAWPFGDGRWLLGRMRASAIGQMIDDLDVGSEGQATVLDRNGVVLARQPDGGRAIVGLHTPLPAELRQARGMAAGVRVSPVDGVERIAGFSANSGYDIVTAAGLGRRETLVPWYRSLSIAGGFVLLYWLGLGYFLHRLARGERVREGLVDELEEQAEWLDQAQRAARTGVWRLEADGRHVKVSEYTAAMFGFEPRAGVLPVRDFFERMHGGDRGRVERLVARALKAGESYSTEWRIRTADGAERWIRSTGGLVTDHHGQQRFTGTVVDVTASHWARERIERAEAQFRALFERNPLPFWVFDEASLRFLAVNEAAIASYGYSQEEFLAMTILDIHPPTEREMGEATIRSRRGERELSKVEGIWTHRRRDGSCLDVRVFSSAIQFDGRPARLVLAEDISDRIAYERDLAWRATHDSVTGLKRVSVVIDEVNARHAPGARYVAAFVRLRGLELVAPTLGAETSELLLREMAARVLRIGEEFGTAGYWPGESFIVVAFDPARQREMLDALENAIATPVQTRGGAHPIEAWIGIAEGPDPGEDAGRTIGHAALASLQASREMVPMLPYDRSMGDRAAEQIALARRLHSALGRDEFEVHYQPVRRAADGRLVAVEALLRWRLDGDFIPPGVFMPLAEASGLIVPIGRWILEQAALAHGRLVARGLHDVAIAVNVSAVQLLGDNIAEAVLELQQRHGLARGALHVELTESVVLHQPQAARARMLQLRAAGVRISIDDFGTGFSSMTYLRNLPLDYLKIDRSFVRGVHTDGRNASICVAVIQLARGLGLATIAEGVEHPGELAWLEAQGCDYVQGYLLGRPAPLEELLDTHRVADSGDRPPGQGGDFDAGQRRLDSKGALPPPGNT